MSWDFQFPRQVKLFWGRKAECVDESYGRRREGQAVFINHIGRRVEKLPLARVAEATTGPVTDAGVTGARDTSSCRKRAAARGGRCGSECQG